MKNIPSSVWFCVYTVDKEECCTLHVRTREVSTLRRLEIYYLYREVYIWDTKACLFTQRLFLFVSFIGVLYLQWHTYHQGSTLLQSLQVFPPSLPWLCIDQVPPLFQKGSCRCAFSQARIIMWNSVTPTKIAVCPTYQLQNQYFWSVF